MSIVNNPSWEDVTSGAISVCASLKLHCTCKLEQIPVHASIQQITVNSSVSAMVLSL